MLENIKIRNKILMTVGVLLVFLLLVALTGYWGITRIHASNTEAVQRAKDISNLYEMLYYMAAQYQYQADLIINGNPQSIQDFQQKAALMDQAQQTVAAHIDSNQERAWFQQMGQADQSFDSLFNDQIVPAFQAGDSEKMKALDSQSDQFMSQMADLVYQKLVPSYTQEMDAAENAIGSTGQQVLNLLVLMSLAAGAMGLAMGIVISNNISNSLKGVIQAAEAMSNGRLDQRALVKGRDEVSVLAKTFNQMADQLKIMLTNEQKMRQQQHNVIEQYMAYMTQVGRGDLTSRLAISSDGTVGSDDPLRVLGHNLNDTSASLRAMLLQISQNAGDINSAAAEILAATTQQASGASEQNAAITQTTSTVDEVRAIAEQSGNRAQEVADSAQQTVQVSRGGQQAVQEVINSMAQIKDQVEGIAENILALSEQTQQIGEIIATVNEIASQSNMLALNASVEAARAGEHGRGFAVVASEVRALAEQSRQATSQVKSILWEIQKATNVTVMATEEGTKSVSRGLELANQAAEAIRQLSGVINDNAHAAFQVVTSGRQQQTGMEQISAAMVNINQATMQSLASTRQAERAAQNLNELARKMIDLFGKYRLN